MLLDVPRNSSQSFVGIHLNVVLGTFPEVLSKIRSGSMPEIAPSVLLGILARFLSGFLLVS